MRTKRHYWLSSMLKKQTLVQGRVVVDVCFSMVQRSYTANNHNRAKQTCVIHKCARNINEMQMAQEQGATLSTMNGGCMAYEGVPQNKPCDETG